MYKLVILVIIITLFYFLYYQNNSLVISKLQINSRDIPNSFNKCKIVHLSDLHNKRFGNNQKKLVKAIKEINPDFIVFTGDSVDSRLYNEKPALTLLSQILEIAPVYYVTGNHEWKSGRYYTLKEKIKELGVKILDNKFSKLQKGNDYIYIMGISDPQRYSKKTRYQLFKNKLINITNKIDEDKYKILLCHRPELLPLYTSQNINLVFTGHAHGGQIRLPIIGGVFVPNQGFFPKYTSGIYNEDKTKMVVSRGLGNSSIAPQRLFNRPEIIVLILNKHNN
ncbi:metallophosphoesterase [Thermohalobacter berrensis]|uniref:Phosphoesterase n=1 Tax=Thermohalobacter berrensis TaxID=99594 RepID=A0A419SXT2_9FIRM|nr:metallophosphoesterase [Thermohalobacter berrensis]RKD30018.1 phosphoesterase [Thermohalobacter berrensis]